MTKTNSDNFGNLSAEQLKERATNHRAAAEESFERCDTDGFLSQWAHGICAHRDELQAMVVQNGGKHDFPALFDLQGKLVAAKLIAVQSRFHHGKDTMWGVLENDDPSSKVIAWIKAHPARQSTMERKGYREGTVRVPAKAVIAGETTAYATIIRLDRGFSRDAEIIDNGILMPVEEAVKNLKVVPVEDVLAPGCQIVIKPEGK